VGDSGHAAYDRVCGPIKKLILPDNVIVVGPIGPAAWGRHRTVQRETSRGWRAIIAFARRAAAARAFGGKPNQTVARPDRLGPRRPVEFGRTARHPHAVDLRGGTIPSFGPALSMRKCTRAYTEAGGLGNAEYHLFLSFGSDGHFMIDSPDGIPFVDALW